MFRKVIGFFISISLLFSSPVVVFATEKDKAMDKKPFLERFQKMDQEVGYSEFYKNANPNDKDFQEKFKEFAKKLDKTNKKYGYKNSFDLERILKSNDLKNETFISMGGGNGDGVNNMSASLFANGDIALINNPGFHIQGAIQHAGMMNRSRYSSSSSRCFLSAQPGYGVLYESGDQYRAYDECWKMGVPSANRDAAVNKSVSVAGEGEPYVWQSEKNDTTRWYCSKVPWYGYKWGGNKDIDFDYGYWCLPIDIYNDGDTISYNYWS